MQYWDATISTNQPISLISESNQTITTVIFNQEIITPSILLVGTNGSQSILVVQDVDTLNAFDLPDAFYPTTMNISSTNNDASTIGGNGNLILNSSPDNASMTLNNIELKIENNGVFTWQRGKIQGSPSSKIKVTNGGALIMEPSDQYSLFTTQRILRSPLEIQSLWIFPEEGTNPLTCSPIPIPEGDSSIVELLIENTNVLLDKDSKIDVQYQASNKQIVLNRANITIRSEDVSSGPLTWTLKESTWNQTGRVILKNIEANSSTINIATGGNLVCSESSFFLFQSTLEVIDGTLTVTNNSVVEMRGSTFRTDDKTLIAVLENSALLLDTAGKKFIMEDNSQLLSRTNGRIEIIGEISLRERASIIIDEFSEIVVNAPQMCEVEESAICFCHCNVTASYAINCATNDTCLDQCLSEGLSCQGTECSDWGCAGFCKPACTTGYIAKDTTLKFTEDSSIAANIESKFTLNFGNISLTDNHQLRLNTSEFIINAGTFDASGHSNFDFVDGSLEVTGGTIYFRDQSTIRAVNGSELEVGDGEIEFTSDARILLVGSKIELVNGNLTFSGNASFVSSSSPFTSLGDDLESEDGEMEVEITGGTMKFSDTSSTEFANSTEVEITGRIEMFNNSRILVTSSTVNLNASVDCDLIYNCSCTCNLTDSIASYGILCSPGLGEESCEDVCDVFACVDTDCSNVDCEHDCEPVCYSDPITLRGHVLLSGNSTAKFENSNFTITSGALIVQETHILEVDTTNIQITDGFWHSENNSLVNLKNSFVSIGTGGALNFTDSSELQQLNSTVEVFGIIDIGGHSVDIASSNMIIQQGKLTFLNSVSSAFHKSYILLLGKGNIYVSNKSNSSFSESQVEISSGTMFIQNNGYIEITQDSLLNISSSLICNNDSELFVNSSIVSVGGNFSLAENSISKISYSNVTIGSDLISNSGDITLNDFSSLFVSEFSSTSLTGNLRLNDNSSCLVSNNSSIIIEGNGELVLTGNSSLTITSNSYVSVAQGSVTISDSGRIEITENSYLITNDFIDLQGDTEVYIPEGNQFIIDTSGDVAVKQRLDVSSANTQYNSNSIPTIDNSGVLDLSSSTGGNIYIPVDNQQNGVLYMGESRFNLVTVRNSGNFYFERSHISIVDNSTTGDLSQPNKQPLQMNKGSKSQGLVSLSGDFINEGEIQHDDTTGSFYKIGGKYSSSHKSVIYVTILDPTKPGAGYTLMDIQDSAELAGTIEICIPNSAKLGNTKSLDIMKFGSLLSKFKDIKFKCSAGHNSASGQKVLESKRTGIKLKTTQHTMLKAASNGCTSTEYGSGSFTVLFDGCGNNNESERMLYTWLSCAFAGAAIILVIIAIAIYEIKPVRNFLSGKEASRISHVRKVQSQLRSGSKTLDSFSSTSIEP